MRTFCTKLLIFIFSIVLFFLGLNYAIDKGLHKTERGNYAEWNAIYNSKINADVLIMGSSRAWTHISPKILDSVLHTNSYNLGMNGYNFDMQYKRFRIYLQHNKKPKTIIHSLDIITLDKRLDLYSSEQFLPYLNDPLMQYAVKDYENDYDNYFFFLPYYKYHFSAYARNTGLCEFFGIQHYKSEKYKGYLGKDLPWDFQFEKFKETFPRGYFQKIDYPTIELFKDYLSYCAKNNIKVILVYTPEYYEIQKMFVNRSYILDIFKEEAAKFNLNFLDYSTDSLCFQKKMFYNSQHLNRHGAEIFSKKLAKWIGLNVPIYYSEKKNWKNYKKLTSSL